MNRRDYRFIAVVLGVIGLLFFAAGTALGGAWWPSVSGLGFMGLAIWIWIQY
jgi:hypothetical protein